MTRAMFLILMLAAPPALAASGTDPDWPCIQRKQPHLSLGQVWTGPVPDDAVTARARDPVSRASPVPNIAETNRARAR